MLKDRLHLEFYTPELKIGRFLFNRDHL